MKQLRKGIEKMIGIPPTDVLKSEYDVGLVWFIRLKLCSFPGRWVGVLVLMIKMYFKDDKSHFVDE